MSFTFLHIYALSITFFALPQLLVLGALPPSLQNLLPACASTCLQSYLQHDFVTSICPDSTDLDCLCSHYGSDGYTLGERAYACLYSDSCTPVSRSNGTSVFSICANRSNAVPPTHRTLLITATPSIMTSSASSAAVVTTMAMSTSAIEPMPSAAITTMSSGATVSTGPGGGKMSASISLTMAQIAGITISAAALLILAVGIACCLIFVRKRNKRLEQEDRKILTWDNPPNSQYNPQVPVPPRKDPRGRIGGVGFLSLQRYSLEPEASQEQQRTWPRYYPVVPDERAIEAIVNQSLISSPHLTVQASCLAQISPSKETGGRLQRSNINGQVRRDTGIVISPPPLPPTKVHQRRSKSPPLSIPQNLQPRNDLSPTSAVTDFEDDDPSLRPRSNFAGSRPMTIIDLGEWPKPPTKATPAVESSLLRQRISRPPTLTIATPKAIQTTPVQLSFPPQRPPLLRQEPVQQARAQQLPFPPTPSQSQLSSYSSAIASSQALGASIGYGTSSRQSSEDSASNSRRPSKSSARSDSQTSYTSFESLGSCDDPTPPTEEDKRLSPVHESPVSYLRYPKVPRASNQSVPRTPPGQWSRESGVSSLGNSPNLRGIHSLRGSPSSMVTQGIGNKLWKTEISP